MTRRRGKPRRRWNWIRTVISLSFAGWAENRSDFRRASCTEPRLVTLLKNLLRGQPLRCCQRLKTAHGHALAQCSNHSTCRDAMLGPLDEYSRLRLRVVTNRCCLTLIASCSFKSLSRALAGGPRVVRSVASPPG